MAQAPDRVLSPEKRAKIEAAAEQTAEIVHRFLQDVDRAVAVLREDLDAVARGGSLGGRWACEPWKGLEIQAAGRHTWAPPCNIACSIRMLCRL